MEIISSWGLKVIPGSHLFSDEHSYLGASDEHRKKDFQQFISDSSIRAIFCARGGYGTTRILDQLDFSPCFSSPKWIVGFSDITALHLKLHHLKLESIHGIMPLLFGRKDANPSIESLRQALFFDPQPLVAHAHPNNREGVGQGPMIGGNLSLVVDSLGTSSEFDPSGKILVLEEIDEHLYKIDRMMVQLKRAGKLNALAGLALGYFSDLKDSSLPFGEPYENIISQHVKDFSYPVGFLFPIGHEFPNMAWRHGAVRKLTVSKKGSRLS